MFQALVFSFEVNRLMVYLRMASIGSLLSFSPRDDSGQQNTDSGLSAAIITIVALFIILVVLTLVLRVYTRIIVLKDFGWEECKTAPNTYSELVLTCIYLYRDYVPRCRK